MVMTFFKLFELRVIIGYIAPNPIPHCTAKLEILYSEIQLNCILFACICRMNGIVSRRSLLFATSDAEAYTVFAFNANLILLG